MAEIILKKRYKYAGDIFQELVENAGFQPEVASALLNDIPDADVAPRAEVAREIFADVEVLLKETCERGYAGSISDLLAELKNKYAEGEK